MRESRNVLLCRCRREDIVEGAGDAGFIEGINNQPAVFQLGSTASVLYMANLSLASRPHPPELFGKLLLRKPSFNPKIFEHRHNLTRHYLSILRHITSLSMNDHNCVIDKICLFTGRYGYEHVR